MTANVLVLSPVKNAAHEAAGYVDRLLQLTYPAEHLAVGILEGDSTDDSYAVFAAELGRLAAAGWRSTRMWKRDFGYQIPAGVERWERSIQLARRRVLALSRNHLLFNALTSDIDWVLWLDADVIEFRADIIELLLGMKRDILQPHCLHKRDGTTFDLNAWRDKGRLHLDDLRDEGFIVPLDTVGGTMLLVRADCHRDGLIWPAFRYGLGNDKIRTDPSRLGRKELGEIETEGLGIMANDMGLQCWGLPHVEIFHR